MSPAEGSLRRRLSLPLAQTATSPTGSNGKHVLIDFGSMGYKHASVGSGMEIVLEFPDDGAEFNKD
tara:strand:+ start:19436 stop:19633 length:198 start_codon:yes stop_codon:yes gene_type:complete